jgi:hypothetical protein
MDAIKTGAIAVGATVLAVGLYFGFRPKAVKQEQFTAPESACLASLAPQFQQLIATQLAQQNAETQQAIAAYGQNKSQPNFDAAMALSDYKDKLANVKIYTLYCEQYAQCLPTRPQKATFDGCYSVFSLYATPDIKIAKTKISGMFAWLIAQR